MTPGRYQRRALAGQPRFMIAHFGRKLFWNFGSRFRLRVRLASLEIKFFFEFVDRLTCVVILRESHHLFIDRIRSLQSEIILEGFQITRDAVPIAQIAPTR